MPDGALLVVTKRLEQPTKSRLCGASPPGTPRNRVRTSWMLTWAEEWCPNFSAFSARRHIEARPKIGAAL
jgi:hypothetical protein